MNEFDQQIRLAAFQHCAQLLKTHTGAVPWAAIQPGFRFEGEQVFLGSTPRGIHRPSQMQRGILSIKTTKPKQGRSARYDDALSDDGYFSYAFQGTDPGNRDNTALRQAFEDQTPFLYFYGLVPGVYEILFPCYLTDWNAAALRCTVAVGNAHELVRPTKPVDDPVLAMPIDRRYSTVEAKVRLHQAEFRELVLGAYEGRCAITGLPVLGLLEAAHIIPDRDERGRPEVNNGLCLSALHHTAYDHNLLGIDPDGKVHIAEAVLEQQDGPTLEQAIKGYHGQRIRLPRHVEDRPDREALEVRFGEFLGV